MRCDKEYGIKSVINVGKSVGKHLVSRGPRISDFNQRLGIVGYGHIGSQLSVLAESMGMKVLYYDTFPIMVFNVNIAADCSLWARLNSFPVYINFFVKLTLLLFTSQNSQKQKT